MRNLIVLSLSSLLLLMSCQDASKKIKETEQTIETSNKNAPEINAQIIDSDSGDAAFEWTSEGGLVWDFGIIQQGDSPQHTFTFKNTGSEPLIVVNAKGSCGCTVPKKPEEPILPGETGEIHVQFNSKNKKGAQNKTVTVTANTTPPTTKLRVTGTIEVNE